MEGRNILRQFEVTLPEQVLQDVMTPGKTFQKEIFVPQNVQNDAEKQSCILLNKTSDTLLKFLVTVYQVETTEAGTQEQTSTSSQHTQADQDGTSGPNGDVAVENGQAAPEPTPPPVMCDASMQTEREQVLESGVQTEEKELMTTSAQTDVKEEAETASQTFVPVFLDTDVQTDELEMFEQETQVELLLTEMTTQTDIKVLVENVCQTDIKEYNAGVSQTDISVGLRDEKECQATVAVQCSETQVIIAVEDIDCQTHIDVEDIDCQTHIDVEDGGCQTEVELNDNVTQTEIELDDGVCQTDIAEITNSEVQTEWESCDQATQNVADVQLNTVQTDMSMALQVEGCTQVELDQENKEVQTEEEEAVTSGPAGDPGLPLSQGSTASASSNLESSQDSDIPDVGLDLEAAEVPKVVKLTTDDLQSKDVQDDSCQTDPVTIIIGDASFLMQKIRSSAISPTKVSGSGNEIEIEVQADEAYNPSGFDNTGGSPAKAGTSPSPRRLPVRRGHPRGGPATRGGGRGARTLPPRQPMSTPSPGPPPAPIRRVQAAPSPMVIQPKRELEKRSRGPIPAPGGRGKYSCPFCTITFHESPSLYEHLQDEHHSDTVSRHSKPKGREGKTIIPRMPTSAIPGEGDPSMPVLVPVERTRAGPQQYVVRNVVQEDQDEGLEEGEEDEEEVLVVQQPEEPGLFEEPMEPIIRKIKKRVLEAAEDEEIEEEPQTVTVAQASPRKVVGVVHEIIPEPEDSGEEEEVVRPKVVKRKRRSSVTASPRRKKQELEVEEEEEEEEEEEIVQSRVTRRGVEQSRLKAETHAEEDTQRSKRSHVVVRGRGARRGRRS